MIIFFRQFLEYIWGKQAVANFPPHVLASNSEESKKRIVHSLNRLMRTRADWKRVTAEIFTAEGIPKSTVSRLGYSRTPDRPRKACSGDGPNHQTTTLKDNKARFFLNEVLQPASTLFWDRFYIGRLTEKMNINSWYRMKVSEYKNKEAKREKRCRIPWQQKW